MPCENPARWIWRARISNFWFKPFIFSLKNDKYWCVWRLKRTSTRLITVFYHYLANGQGRFKLWEYQNMLLLNAMCLIAVTERAKHFFRFFIKTQEKMQYCNWAFKKKLLPFYPRLKKFFIWKSNGKSLSNCNSNCRGQPSGWIGWLLPSCTLCTYPEPIKRNLNKKRSSLIIILLYSVWYCGRFQAPCMKNSIFRLWRWYCKAPFEPLKH